MATSSVPSALWSKTPGYVLPSSKSCQFSMAEPKEISLVDTTSGCLLGERCRRAGAAAGWSGQEAALAHDGLDGAARGPSGWRRRGPQGDCDNAEFHATRLF